MNLLEKQRIKEILHETDCKSALTELISLFENTFNSDPRPHLHNYTTFKTMFVKDTIIDDIDFIKKEQWDRIRSARCSRLKNDTNTDDADIIPIYDEEPMVEVQLTAECNIIATRQHHTKQPEIIPKVKVDQYTEQCQVKSPMFDSSFDNKTSEFSNQSLESKN
nr:hypothetical protein [Tanacetum cinerariifolium]